MPAVIGGETLGNSLNFSEPPFLIYKYGHSLIQQIFSKNKTGANIFQEHVPSNIFSKNRTGEYIVSRKETR